MADTSHVDPAYEAALQALREQLLTAGRLASAELHQAVDGLLHGNGHVCRHVEQADADLDRADLSTERSCVALLARYAPVGRDLRLVLGTLRALVDLERIGDYAVDIAERSHKLHKDSAIPPIPEVLELADLARDLTDQALAAFASHDTALARSLRLKEDHLDALNKATYHRMISLAKHHPARVDSALAWTTVSRHLERVGDHAINLAEVVVYVEDGEVLRHSHPTAT